MPSAAGVRRQIDAIDRQLIELLARRTALVRQVASPHPDNEPDREREAQVLSNWLEEAFDYDLDEAATERVCKAVMELERRAREVA